MPVQNEEIARIFDEIADLLALQNENPFRIRAYQRAAQYIRGQQRQMSDRVRESADPGAALDALPGIGADLGAKIIEIVNTGRCKALLRLRKQVPHGLLDLLRIPGFGPKRVQAVHARLGVRSRKDLERVIRTGAISKVPGFGPGLTAKVERELKAASQKKARWLRPLAAQLAEPLAAKLRVVRGVDQVILAGSYRRGRDTVGDIDLLVSADNAAAVTRALQQYRDIEQWIALGPRRVTVRLRGGLQVDVRISKPDQFGAALFYFTGSKAHNIHVRLMARERRLKINEYGVFRGSKCVAGKTEESVFTAVGLPWISPEMREDLGEIELARSGKLPELVTREDLHGDLHSHTDASDGQESLEAMVGAARAAGLEYLAITDHSKYLGVVHGLDVRRLRRQMDAIDMLNGKLRGITLLKGVEVDILEDGSLALPDAFLAEMDVVVASIHSHFDLGGQKQTRRVLRAMEHRAFSILGHPSARLIGERRPIELDMERICAAAKSRPCYLELNGMPERLDLDDAHCRLAREHGVLISIASDAHSGAQFSNLDFGVTQARRGWLRAPDVLNGRRLAEVRRLLSATFL
ncbi:MAG: DNA polymerase/3'-5' exonuclease PolX [Steroidobacteraceae bacterium]